MKLDLVLIMILATYMPSEPLVLKGFWDKNQVLFVSFKKMTVLEIPKFEKQIRYVKQLLRKPKFQFVYPVDGGISLLVLTILE